MVEENLFQVSVEEEMEAKLIPRINIGHPNDSPDSKDQLLSKDVDICGHYCHKKSSACLQEKCYCVTCVLHGCMPQKKKNRSINLLLLMHNILRTT